MHAFRACLSTHTEAKDTTQADLADQAGITRPTVHAIEHNKSSPSLEVAFRFARAFKVSLEDVFQCQEGPEEQALRGAAGHRRDTHMRAKSACMLPVSAKIPGGLLL